MKTKRNFISLLGILLLPAAIFAQSISGKVTDTDTGEPLVGANVVVEGTDLGAAAQADGTYSIKVDEGF